jgi:phosphatidylglycerophosphate synthase
MLSKVRKSFEPLISPLVFGFEKAGITPNVVTTLSLLLLIPASYFILKKEEIISAGFVLLIGVFDWLDGTLASRTGKTTKFGEFYDSFSDRIAEGVLYSTISISYEVVPLGFSALILSYLTSYIAAKAPNIKYVGIGTRAERMLVLIAALTFQEFFQLSIKIGLTIICAVACITILQRTYNLYHRLKNV